MKIGQLITYSFSPNVGTADRLVRLASGLAVAALPWTVLTSPSWAAWPITVLGIGWALTGVVSRCGIYYMLGISTRGG